MVNEMPRGDPPSVCVTQDEQPLDMPSAPRLCSALANLVEIQAVQVVDGGLALVPTEAGWSRLVRQGKAATVASLRRRLTSQGIPATPSAWRFVKKLPGSAPCRPMQPSWQPLAADDKTWQGEAVVGNDLAVLQGHFPNEPIVPGVAQVLWAAMLARRVFPAVAHHLTGEVRGLKFKRPIQPGGRLRVSLTLQDVDPPRHVAFGYRSDGEHSHGRLLLGR